MDLTHVDQVETFRTRLRNNQGFADFAMKIGIRFGDCLNLCRKIAGHTVPTAVEDGEENLALLIGVVTRIGYVAFGVGGAGKGFGGQNPCAGGILYNI
jgi:hypothetical protein